MSDTVVETDEPSLEERVKAKEMVDSLLRHISNVQEACVLQRFGESHTIY